MSKREASKYIIDMIPEKDISTVYNVLIKFIPEDDPFPDEIEAIKEIEKEKRDKTRELIPYDKINWD